MLLWVLCLKLWWLLLPLGIVAHPSTTSTLSRRSRSERLEIRDTDSWADVNQVDATQIETFPARYYRSAPLIIDPSNGQAPLVASGPMTNESMLNPIWFWYRGNGILNLTGFSNLGRIVPIDFEYPPFTEKKLFVRLSNPFECGQILVLTRVQSIHGSFDTDNSDCQIEVDVLGFPLGDFKGNLDDGLRVDVNILVAKGDLILYEIRGKPKDQIWIKVDLNLPFHQHFNKKIHMFDLPHRDIQLPNANNGAVTA
ncbi:MAG: hypothetical protein Q9218_005887 [Villophora microphyllina]